MAEDGKNKMAKIYLVNSLRTMEKVKVLNFSFVYFFR